MTGNSIATFESSQRQKITTQPPLQRSLFVLVIIVEVHKQLLNLKYAKTNEIGDINNVFFFGNEKFIKTFYLRALDYQ